jgi:ATP-dependent Clp protease ATP-binding subunit ClpX
LKEIVKLAIEKKAGARALRSVMEEHLMELMYQIPDMQGVERVIITKDVILNGEEPIYKEQKKRRSA